MDGCHGWDAWGHEAGIDEVGIIRWSVLGGHGGGVAAGCRIDGGADVHERGLGGEPRVIWVQVECGWWRVNEGGVGSSGYNGGNGVSWRVDGGVMDEDGAVCGACDP